MKNYSQLRDIGYESFNLFLNLGTLAFFGILYIIKVLYLLILGPLAYLTNSHILK